MYQKIVQFVSLKQGEENPEKVLENVKANISFRGSNLWILACAIVVASVGLNVNSTAVIIGAMLISPLMGPIVGAGVSLAIFDFDLLKKSGKNLLIATLVSLSVACCYFYISPFKETQSELLARTSPNIYDVLIAFFGGLVGVIAITRVEKGNPIPGVAIATALMPPLCTAGYGLSVGNVQFFLGAFFLYMINCFFICISTYLVIKQLKYPHVVYVEKSVEKRIRIIISLILFLMIVPSTYLAYELWKQKQFSYKLEQFMEREFNQKGYTILFQKTNFNSKPKRVELAFLNHQFSDEEIKEINDKAALSGLENTDIQIKHDLKDLKNEILNEISSQDKVLGEKEKEIEILEETLSSFDFRDLQVDQELKVLFPEISSLSIGKHTPVLQSKDPSYQYVVIYSLQNPAKEPNLEKLRDWIGLKLKSNAVLLMKQP